MDSEQVRLIQVGEEEVTGGRNTAEDPLGERSQKQGRRGEVNVVPTGRGKEIFVKGVKMVLGLLTLVSGQIPSLKSPAVDEIIPWA